MRVCSDCPCYSESEDGEFCSVGYETIYKMIPSGKRIQCSTNCKLVAVITEDKTILASTFDVKDE